METISPEARTEGRVTLSFIDYQGWPPEAHKAPLSSISCKILEYFLQFLTNVKLNGINYLMYIHVVSLLKVMTALQIYDAGVQDNDLKT